MRRDEIRGLLEGYGPEVVCQTVLALLEGRELENGNKYKLSPHKFSVRAMWEGLVGDQEDTLPSYLQKKMYVKEAIDSSVFIAVTKMLLAAKVIEGYDSVKGIGEQLTSNEPSSRRIENVAGFTSMEGLKTVVEGGEYEDSSISDKYVTTKADKKGRLISITEEAVMEDQTNQILSRAGNFGEMAAMDKEKTIISGVLDVDSNVYRPSGVPTAVYSTALGNLCGTAGAITGFTTAIPLLDWTDLDEVEDFHSQSLGDDRQVGRKEPIMWNPSQMLVSKGKANLAKRILNATEIRSATGSGAETTIFNNPRAGGFSILSSEYIAWFAQTGYAGDWYYGNFKKQFHWQDIWPIQVQSAPSTMERMFLNDTVALFKVRYLGGIYADDYRHVVKVKAS
jgi:hypothetical protein